MKYLISASLQALSLLVLSNLSHAYFTQGVPHAKVVDYCVYPHSWYSSYTAPTCRPLQDTSSAHWTVNVGRPGSFEAGAVVRGMRLFSGNDGQGESCYVGGNRFDGRCNDEDWRWRVSSVRFLYHSCQLFTERLSLDNLTSVIVPSGFNVPVAAGHCSDHPPLSPSGNSEDGDYSLYGRYYNLLDGTGDLQFVCAPGSSSQFPLTLLNTDGVARQHHFAVPGTAACLPVMR